MFLHIFSVHPKFKEIFARATTKWIRNLKQTANSELATPPLLIVPSYKNLIIIHVANSQYCSNFTILYACFILRTLSYNLTGICIWITEKKCLLCCCDTGVSPSALAPAKIPVFIKKIFCTVRTAAGLST